MGDAPPKKRKGMENPPHRQFEKILPHGCPAVAGSHEADCAGDTGP